MHFESTLTSISQWVRDRQRLDTSLDLIKYYALLSLIRFWFTLLLLCCITYMLSSLPTLCKDLNFVPRWSRERRALTSLHLSLYTAF